MSKAKDFIENPLLLHKLLAAKYFSSPEDFNFFQIDWLISGKHFKLKVNYAEIQLASSHSDILKRLYSTSEVKKRIPKLTEYYKTYQTFFCNPFFNNWHFTHLLSKHYEAKAELFYLKNYHDKNEDSIASLERNADEEESSHNEDVTSTKTIFNEKLRQRIDRITQVKEVMNTLSIDGFNMDSLSSRAIELYTRRSINDSLRNVILSFSKGSGSNKGAVVSIKSQGKGQEHCTAVKSKEKEKKSLKPMRPLHKSFLNKLHSNQANSIKSMEALLQVNNQPTAKLHFKKASIVSSSRNPYQNSSMFRRISNDKTFELTILNNKNTFKDNLLQCTTSQAQPLGWQTRNSTNPFTLFNQKTISNAQSNGKTPSHKIYLSHCSSALSLMKSKPTRCSLVKQSDLLKPIVFHNTLLSRNKKKEASVQLGQCKNNPIIQLTTLSKMNVNQHKITKSLDAKNSRVALPPNSRLNFREFSKAKKQELPLSYKQINELMKYAKSSKPPSKKKH